MISTPIACSHCPCFSKHEYYSTPASAFGRLEKTWSARLQVIYGQRTARHPLIGARVEKLDELPVFTIPGIWMLMPSTKGYVRFTPHFLSQVELRKAWVSLRIALCENQISTRHGLRASLLKCKPSTKCPASR